MVDGGLAEGRRQDAFGMNEQAAGDCLAAAHGDRQDRVDADGHLDEALAAVEVNLVTKADRVGGKTRDAGRQWCDCGRGVHG
ncbi:MAG: hypothetical protein ACREEV_01830, partial [Dongiaceae bacterium]